MVGQGLCTGPGRDGEVWPRVPAAGLGKGRLSEKKLGDYTRQFLVVRGEARRRGREHIKMTPLHFALVTGGRWEASPEMEKGSSEGRG